MPILSDHEAILMELMVRGEGLFAIGAHKEPLLSLEQRGFVKRSGLMYYITPNGAAAFEAFEADEMGEGNVIEGDFEECP